MQPNGTVCLRIHFFLKRPRNNFVRGDLYNRSFLALCSPPLLSAVPAMVYSLSISFFRVVPLFYFWVFFFICSLSNFSCLRLFVDEAGPSHISLFFLLPLSSPSSSSPSTSLSPPGSLPMIRSISLEWQKTSLAICSPAPHVPPSLHLSYSELKSSLLSILPPPRPALPSEANLGSFSPPRGNHPVPVCRNRLPDFLRLGPRSNGRSSRTSFLIPAAGELESWRRARSQPQKQAPVGWLPYLRLQLTRLALLASLAFKFTPHAALFRLLEPKNVLRIHFFSTLLVSVAYASPPRCNKLGRVQYLPDRPSSPKDPRFSPIAFRGLLVRGLRADTEISGQPGPLQLQPSSPHPLDVEEEALDYHLLTSSPRMLVQFSLPPPRSGQPFDSRGAPGVSWDLPPHPDSPCWPKPAKPLEGVFANVVVRPPSRRLLLFFSTLRLHDAFGDGRHVQLLGVLTRGEGSPGPPPFPQTPC